MRAKNEETKLKIYEYINSYIKEHRVSPSIKDIAKEANCAVSTAYKFLVRLEEEGLIERCGRKQIISDANKWVFECIPVVGLVACGKPKLAVEDIQTYMPVNKDLLGMGEYIALVASGDSMINAGIDDGDIVIVRKQPTAEEGQIVVAMVQNDYEDEYSATLKRFYRTKSRNVFRLHPENSKMEDMFINNIEIVGVAVKVIKDLE